MVFVIHGSKTIVKLIVLATSLKNKLDVILVRQPVLCADEYNTNDVNSTVVFRLKYYIDPAIIQNYSDQCNFAQHDSICVCMDNKISDLKAFYAQPKQNKIDIFDVDKYTLSM